MDSLGFNVLEEMCIVEISSEYLDVELSHIYVDNAVMQLVCNPKQISLWLYKLSGYISLRLLLFWSPAWLALTVF